MKNAFSKIVLLGILFLLLLTISNTADAVSARKGFSGKILNTKATEIQSMEDANYKCIVLGKTITIKPTKSSDPTSYFIPAIVKSKTNNSIRSGVNILGLYSQSKTTITCIFQGTPPSSTTVQLTPITMYGTSKE